jgi:hypothetical protein
MQLRRLIMIILKMTNKRMFMDKGRNSNLSQKLNQIKKKSQKLKNKWLYGVKKMIISSLIIMSSLKILVK